MLNDLRRKQLLTPCFRKLQISPFKKEDCKAQSASFSINIELPANNNNLDNIRGNAANTSCKTSAPLRNEIGIWGQAGTVCSEDEKWLE